MKSQQYALLIAALVGQQSEAFQTAPFSRKAFLSKVATTTGAIVAAGSLSPNSALAAPKEKAPKKEAFRGGKEMSDALHNGTDLDKGQAAMAGGLLDKMGLPDITPDKGTNVRAPPRRKN